MGEMLLVARKGKDGGDDKIIAANLRRLPRDFVEAHETARALQQTIKSGELKIGDYVFATGITLSAQNGNNWGAVGVWNYETALIAEKMISGIFLNPGLLANPLSRFRWQFFPRMSPTHRLIVCRQKAIARAKRANAAAVIAGYNF